MTNSGLPLAELLHNDRAILLENALWDTSTPINPHIPNGLRSGADPGAYIVQAKSRMDASFRAGLEAAGAVIVSYIPNNALLIRASVDSADAIAHLPGTAALLRYEAGYKLKRNLLALALSPAESRAPLEIDVLLLPGGEASFERDALEAGFTSSSVERSAIGVIHSGQCASDALAALARLPQVQAIQSARHRASATDLARAFTGISSNSTTTASYLGLTGSNVLIALADTGVDGTHPDLVGRLTFDSPEASVDTAGHGTYVAGVIAGSGASSLLASNVPGSAMPPADRQFRGMAPAAKLHCATLAGTNPPSNTQLQTSAATTNALISNNSWVYEGVYDYDFAAASYDVAIRDALPLTPGSQPLLVVFPAGNAGQGLNDGTGGAAGSIASPGTAKNVVTVGALEQARWITNTVVTCTNEGSGVVCVTNQPWLGGTDSSNQVAAFSGRGNVGVGTEGEMGRFKPDVVAPGSFLVSTRSAQWDQESYFGGSSAGLVLSNLNEQLGPRYRFESGTSIAAAGASGSLALIQEFFTSRLSQNPSPALLKALLIHGAQPNAGSGLAIKTGTNRQGWGTINLPASLHPSLTNPAPALKSMFVEQDTWLSTGHEVTFTIRLHENPVSGPLLCTLAWTDPAGHPMAGLKLVNDLDIVVTNLDSGAVYFGNDIACGSQWSSAWSGSPSPSRDSVNNVEKIRIYQPADTNYSITVKARRVNVDCGSGRFDEAAQDFAVVVSCGDSGEAPAIELMTTVPRTNAPPEASALTATNFGPGLSGAILIGQRFGSHAPGSDETLVSLSGSTPPLAVGLGQTNQWRFFVITNQPGFTYAAFTLFDSRALSSHLASSSEGSADLDLYVSQDPALLQFSPSAFASAARSIRPRADELILQTDAPAGVYYIAVKCESHRGGQASLAVFFDQQPFSSVLQDGRLSLRGVPSPSSIPSATNTAPEAGLVFFFPPTDVNMRRITASNVVSHPFLGDAQTWLYHDRDSVLLQDFSSATGVVSAAFVFDDSLELDLPGAIPPAVPGSMTRWNGTVVSGPWILRQLSRGAAGTNEASTLTLYPDSPEIVEIVTIQPGAERWEYFSVPRGCTNILGQVSIVSGTGPLWSEVAPASQMTNGFNQITTTAWNTATIEVNAHSDPPPRAGLWRARLRNTGTTQLQCQLGWTLTQDTDTDPWHRFRSGGTNVLRDDALTVIDIPVTCAGAVSSIEAGLRLEHPRLGDLEFTLVSPSGNRVALQSHRGSFSTNGLGLEAAVTNLYPVASSGGPQVASNTFNLRLTSGTISVYYDFYGIPDWMRVFYETNVIFDTGLASGSADVLLPYGPGESTYITVVMNEGDNSDPNTAWEYIISASHPDFGFFTYTDDAAAPPVKFVLPPFDVTPAGQDRLRVRPDEPLSVFAGEQALGSWKIEIRDAFPGPSGESAYLVESELAVLLADVYPRPTPLSEYVPAPVALAPFETRWFEAATYAWTEGTTNCILNSDLSVNLLFSLTAPGQSGVPTATVLLENTTAGCVTLTTNSAPPLPSGTKFYLGVQNTNNAFAHATIQTQTAPIVRALSNRMPMSEISLAPEGCAYYTFTVAPGSGRAQFRLFNVTGDVALLARRGLPLANEANAAGLSDNPGSANEMIVMRASDVPLILAPGAWFITVTNRTPMAVSYEIEAGQWAGTGLPIVISPAVSDGQIHLSWASLPGVEYQVQVSDDLTGSNWTGAGGIITADEEQTTASFPVAPPFHFFRVVELSP